MSPKTKWKYVPVLPKQHEKIKKLVRVCEGFTSIAEFYRRAAEELYDRYVSRR